MKLVQPSPAFFLLLALLSLALALLVRFKARPGAVRNYFSLFAVSVAFWLASGFLLYSNIDPDRALLWARLAFAAGAVLILGLYHVLVSFPDQETARFGWVVNGVGAMFAIVSLTSPLLARDVTSSGVYQVEVRYGPFFFPFTAYAITVLILGVTVLVKRFRRASGLRRLQIQYLLLGTAIPVAGVLLTNLVLPLAFGISTFAPYGRLFVLVFLPVTAHAIIRHRLMDIKVVVRKAVVFGCAIAAGAAIFAGLVSLFGLLGSDIVGRSLPEAVALAIIFAASFQPVKSWIESALNRYVYREQHDYPRILKESSDRLSTILDPQGTAAYMTDVVSRMFKPELAGVYLLDQSRDAFVSLTVSGRGEWSEVARVLPAASPLPSYLEKGKRILARDEVRPATNDGGMWAATEELRDLRGDAAIAFWHLGRLWGFLILGPKLSGDPYFAEDIDFLLTLGSQAAIAIENLQLHRQMEEERLRAERLGVVGTLASGIAHEIKNPLVAIRTFAELLPERFRDEDFHDEFAKIVIKEIGRIDGLVARLRELASRPAQQLVTVELQQPIEETLTLLRGQLEQKDIKVTTEYEKSTPCILGEYDLLKQLFLNLFLNAIDAMELGGELRVRLSMRHALGTEQVIVEVTNTGAGIPEEVLPQIFDPFFSTKPGGSGLGLAICRNIADAHRAKIHARNNRAPGGATFTAEFPVVKAGTIGAIKEVGPVQGESKAGARQHPSERLSARISKTV
jgi:signal transduction histidine kinase